ncbi:MAG: zinc ABC transporter substrate-binding protein [Kiritimatiellae bacterium]|nr:zinc ABC transporter substrate-binding protein [Kiritimatiellia bacterium]
MLQRKIIFLIWAVVFLAAPAARGQTNAPSPVIVCTTTHLSALVEALAGGTLRPETIVPWGMCPGHFELKRSDIEKIRRADLVLRHGYEQFLSAFENDKSYAPITAVAVPGNWMVPAVQKKAAEQTAKILAERFPRNAEIIRAGLAAHCGRIDSLEKELRPFLEKTRNVPVVCSAMSADYAGWAGLMVAAEYKRDEDLSLRNLQEVIQKARDARARLVIDNRQSSGKTGQTLARELDLPLAVISNFPEPDSSGRASYAVSLRSNVMAVCDCACPEP